MPALSSSHFWLAYILALGTLTTGSMGCDPGAESPQGALPGRGNTFKAQGAAGAPGVTPVEQFGQLRVEGAQLVDENGAAVQLKGASSMWLNWEDDGYAESAEALIWMRDHWNLSVIRAAMGIEPAGGYLGSRERALGQVTTIIENAIDAGVYVIIDWHSHSAHMDPDVAEEFFSEMARQYGDHPNVIYEPFNEPQQVSWSTDLKPYYEGVIEKIREHDSDNLVILGTPNWSQYVDQASLDPVADPNVMYTLHFYSCSHDSVGRSRAAKAMYNGAALFVTEWGATHADGGLDGEVCLDEAQAWTDWMGELGISWTAWKLDNCTDSSCYFGPEGASLAGGWTDADLHGHGPFVRDRMRE